MTLSIGTCLGPYEVLGLLGSGGMGEVYRARDTRLGREVALKRLSDAGLAGDEARRRVLHEARAAGALTHQNIAAIYDVLDAPDGLVIVMEYVAGESLATRVSRGPLPVEDALAIAQQVADALAEAHDRGIVHRDLKPANILLTSAGRPKILDFGIARSATHYSGQGSPSDEARTEPGQVIGTPGYMAPEQLAGGHADARTDIYGVGLLLFEMLTGRRPFEAQDYLGYAMEVFEGRTRRITDIEPSLPQGVSAIVSRAMARQPEDRFGNARELSSALGQALKDLSNAQTTVVQPLPRRPWWRTRVAAIGLVLAIAAAVAVMLAMRTRWSAPPAAARSAVVAVAPFRSDTGDGADAAFVVGLTDTIAKRLGGVRSLKFVPLAETREAAREHDDPAQLARIVGAGYIVNGRVRRSGDTLAVRVGLVRDDGTAIPIGEFSGRTDRLLELHRQVGDEVIGALGREGVEAAAAAAAVSEPTTSPEAYAEYVQARTFLERPDVPGNLDRAITLFNRAIERDRRFAIAHAGLGEAYWAQYRETKDPSWTAKAQAANLEALRIDPRLPEVRMALAVMYQGLGRDAAAREELQQVLALQPESDTAHRLLASMLEESGEVDAAIAEAKQAIALRPNYWANHSALGDILLRAGRFEEAVSAYRRFTELQPDSARAFQRLGTAFHALGRLDEALANYRKADSIRPSWAISSGLGTVLYWRGDIAGAIEAYRKAVELGPNQPGPYENLGDALRKAGQKEAANRNYRQAIEQVRKQLSVNEQDGSALASLALNHAKLGEREAAALHLRRALSVAPGDGGVLSVAATVHALAGEKDAACRMLTAALENGESRVTVRYTDEFAGLRGCAAYEDVLRTVR